MIVDDDWTRVEDNQLRRSIEDGESWSDIADALLRSVAAVQARAVHLDRLARLARARELEERVVRPAMPLEERVAAVLEVTSRVKAEPAPKPAPEPAPKPVEPAPVKDRTFDATPRLLSKTCVRCRKPFTADDLWMGHEGGPEHFDCCVHITAKSDEVKPAVVHAKPEKRRIQVRNGGCGSHDRNGIYTCVLRSRHRGDHLTDHGIIFSRDGKDIWRDVGDVYLMMALNNDIVAPQP